MVNDVSVLTDDPNINNDSLVDSPTNYGTDTGAGGEVRGNYATLNPLFQTGTYSNGNLDLTTTAGNRHYRGTIGVSSGKWYWEFSPVSGATPGIIALVNDSAPATQNANQTGGYAYYSVTGNKQTSGVDASYGATYTYGDIIGVAFDADNGTLVFYKNGVSQGTAFTGLTSGPYYPACSAGSSTNTTNFVFNAGARPFAYTAPSGFKALCTTNLPEPTIADGSTAMDVALYTGNGSTQTISGLNFSPDLVWLKNRSFVANHWLVDSVRGVGTGGLSSSLTNAESNPERFSSFNANGFTVASGAGESNDASSSFAAWCWDAGSSTVTNPDGSITSQVRANASAGFSVVTYTGNGNDYPTGATVGHGLGVAPEFLIVKSRGTAGTNWAVWHSKLTAADYTVLLNDTGAQASGSNSFNRTLPTSTVFSVGQAGGGTRTNENGVSHVAYCFAPVDGYSSFGSYTGNGSTDGPFVYTGFRPAFVLLKCSSTAGTSWTIHDNRRLGYNPDQDLLFPNTSDAENPTSYMDFTSNGFKLRIVSSFANASGATFVWAAFAEHPFATSRAR
jgi:hypothetical protein